MPKKNWARTDNQIVLLAMKGKGPSEIAKELGYKDNHSVISKRMKTKELQDRITNIKETVADTVLQVFSHNARYAAKKIVKIAKKGTSKDRIQLDASKDILYMAGCKPVDVVETRTRDYTPEEIESAKKTASELVGITDRLFNKRSEFVLKGSRDESPPSPPVCASTEAKGESKDSKQSSSD